MCEFVGSKYDKNSQVGNAVPPLLAMNISKEVTRSFEEYLRGDENHE